ncbi:nitrate- and nitrite sensing domain-containing protein [Actinomadura sp. 7K507]|uniref:sensor histidine kinase n=1 Tax=Actinomadura sp. 7K507 TaxID=2530365 RepID=UPI001FB7D8B4|nr:nitrate- and nitrite sensing domain-containing protein [Actinomadura sp. 7K507]
MLLSLTALWAFAAWVTLRDGLGLLWANTLDEKISRPTVALVTAMQNERRASVVYVASPGQQQGQALATRRAETDKAVKTVRSTASGRDVSWAASDSLEQRINEMFGALDTLDDSRAIIDARNETRVKSADSYNRIVDTAFRVFNSTGAVLNDEGMSKDSRTLNALTRAKEVLSREDAALAGTIAARRFEPGEHAHFVGLVHTARFLREEAAAELPPADRERFDKLVGGTVFARLSALEQRTVQHGGARPPVQSAEWQEAMAPAQEGMEDLIRTGGDDLVGRAGPVGAGIIVRLALAGGLGLLAVIASIVVSITTARALVRQLERLRDAAAELAEQRLPSVVERLGHGEKVDVAAEAPELQFGDDEIGQVGKAFNHVQRTALATAVEQAELRRGIRDVLLSLARRTQTLVHRQLTMLDTMERRRDIEVKELEELFRLDHLATRMRRNAENLIVLSGALPARGWRNSVPMVDVVRAAVGEVEDYTRVTVLPFGPVELAGRAVGDVTHLLAELIENAVSFSPPDTVVQIGGHLVASGFAIDIEDRGLGMTDDKLTEINERIADPPDFNLQSSVQLGLFVVSKLAERYNVQVSLKRSAYGGTTAVIVIPRELIAEQGPVPVKAGATTQNGLEVRQPAAVGAGGGDSRSSGATATLSPPGTGPQPAGPALVAVPPPASEPSGPARPAPGSPTPESRGADAPGNGAPGSGAPDTPAHNDAVPADGTRSDEGFAPDGGAPATIEPEDQPPVPDSSTTPSGLPVRVPQANLAEPLRSDEQTTAEEPDEQDDPGRSPEEIQRIMGAYQRGTRRGRSDAASRDPSEQADQHGSPPGTNAAEGEEDQ